MEQLPYIDEHSIRAEAAPEQVWRALVSVLRGYLGGTGPALVARLLGAAPAQTRGGWRETIHAGDTLPGFAITEVHAPERLELRGQHRFSRYSLIFELVSDGARCSLRARTRAEFPGLIGPVYSALVIGSGAHRVIVRRLLRNVADRA